MQVASGCTTCSGSLNGQTLGLFGLVVYVAIMPKEIVHLACVVIGATGYLFFLLLQPSMKSRPTAKKLQVTEMCQNIGVEVPECPKFGLQSGAIQAEAINDKQKTSAAAVSDVETTDDESIGVSGDENHDTTSDESIVTMTNHTASTNVAHAKENPTKPAKLASMEGDSSTDSSMKTAHAVCCPRFKRKQILKENRAHFAEFKRLVKEDVQMETEMASDAARKKLSAAAAPYVRRPKNSVDVAPSLCSPCVSHVVPSPVKCDQICWQWESHGFCPRGPACRWDHPPTETFQEQPRGYEIGWEHHQTDMFQKQFQSHENRWECPKTDMFQKQPQSYEAIQHLPTYVAAGFAGEFFKLNDQTMVQSPAPGQCDASFVDHSVLIANISFCDEDNDDLLTDDGF